MRIYKLCLSKIILLLLDFFTPLFNRFEVMLTYDPRFINIAIDLYVIYILDFYDRLLSLHEKYEYR